MKPSGLYAAADLTGDFANAEDIGVLGLAGANDALRPPGAVIRALDNDGASAASHAERGSQSLAFIGTLDARSHGTAPAAEVALDELAQSGEAIPNRLHGEWAFLHWDSQALEATIAVSPAIRDNVHFVSDGKRIAIAPDVETLSRLSWVGRDIDPVGLAVATARAPLRLANPGNSILAGVRRLEPGAVYRLKLGQELKQVSPPPPPEPWEGSFEEALERLESELRLQVRQAIAPHDVVAIPLSGGLDSSLLACIAAEERREGQRIFCLTSVAPTGSDLADERRYATMVAESAGLPIEFVVPPEDADPYVPDPATCLHSGGLVFSPRHYLDSALVKAALDRGASAILFGLGGEASLSRSAQLLTPRSAMTYLPKRALRMWQSARAFRTPQDNFHVRFTPAFLSRLPEEFRQSHGWSRSSRLQGRNSVMGPAQITPSLPFFATSVPGGGIRRYMPLRARQLHQLVAGMPAGFTHRDGLPRALARHILSTRVPPEVWQRTGGLPYSPDYLLRMQSRAGNTADLLGGYRASMAGEYLDLDWLERSLQEVADQGPRSVRHAFSVQMTACCAAFLFNWAER